MVALISCISYSVLLCASISLTWVCPKRFDQIIGNQLSLICLDFPQLILAPRRIVPIAKVQMTPVRFENRDVSKDRWLVDRSAAPLRLPIDVSLDSYKWTYILPVQPGTQSGQVLVVYSSLPSLAPASLFAEPDGFSLLPRNPASGLLKAHSCAYSLQFFLHMF